ncbi:MAG: deoxyhypusine synthase [Thermoprotei archaeon]
MSDFYDKARKELLSKPIKDYTLSTNTTLCEFIEKLGNAHGFMAGHIYRASEILYRMASDDRVFKILAFTGNIVATGLRGLIAQLIREGFFDAVITTCGAVDHDIARGTGHYYYAGEWLVDDAMLADLNIHRLGNVFVPVESYGLAIEKFTQDLLNDLVKTKKEWSPSEILYEAGKRIKDEHSILKACYEQNIPVFIPGIVDGAFGTQIVLHSQFSGLKLDILSDEKKLFDLVFSAEKLGALIIGGGISKHHTIWFAQFKNGLDYAVYLTTAVEYDGSLSGAHTREAISWGKIKPRAEHVVVYGDATITLPLVVAGALCRLRSGGKSG